MTSAERNPVFVRGDEHLDRLLSDPDLAARVAKANVEAEEMDRLYADNLAMIRKAAHLTQVEVAHQLGIGQGAVSRIENRDDMLLSTLLDYLTATGAESASLVVTVRGQKVELNLADVAHHPN